ncbi:MAG: hypothetical protein PHH59_06995 [Methylovulum sp.]|nr:hypothetical protein [Methylovulum sp.]
MKQLISSFENVLLQAKIRLLLLVLEKDENQHNCGIHKLLGVV